MKKLISAAVLLTSLLYAQDLKIAGSSTVYPFSTFVAEEYALIKKVKTPIVESLGTGGGFKVFCENISDVANASRMMKESEFQACKKAGVTDIMGIMIGYDGIVLAQNKINPHLNITLKDLFLALVKEVPQDGKLVPNPYTHWNQINKDLPNRKITIYGPPSSSGTRDTLEELVMLNTSKTFKEYEKPYKDIRADAAYIPSGENDNLIISKLSVDKDAFGLFGYGFLVNNQDKINATKIDDIEPNESNISNGSYKLARSLFIYINTKKNPKVFDFAKIYLSDELAKSGGELEKIGLVPLSDEDLKTMQKHIENKTLLNEQLIKAGKIF